MGIRIQSVWCISGFHQAHRLNPPRNYYAYRNQAFRSLESSQLQMVFNFGNDPCHILQKGYDDNFTFFNGLKAGDEVIVENNFMLSHDMPIVVKAK
jgi:hypothetical protein